jgi:multidrug resistance efflux pump
MHQSAHALFNLSQTKLETRISSLQAQLLSAKHSLSTTEESSSREKSSMESKLTQVQQQLKDAQKEKELTKVSQAKINDIFNVVCTIMSMYILCCSTSAYRLN